MARPPKRAGSPAYVCFAGQDWWCHHHGHSDFQLMRELAGDHVVVVVNSLGMRVPRRGVSTRPWRRILAKLASTARYLRRPLPDKPTFWVMSPLILPLYGSRVGRALNGWLVAMQVRLVCAALRLRRPVVVVTIPTAQPVLAHLRPASVVVNRADKLSLFPEADGPVIAALEERLLRDADHVVFASHALLEEEGPHARQAHFLDHGVDVDHFRRRPPDALPGDLLAIPGPRAGFYGTLDSLVDYDLLALLAAEMPEVQIVLVGSVTGPLGRLEGMPNVHVLGPRPYADIPAYASGFDVALMPWTRTPWIHYCNPIKLKEYLALGLPVVSTAFPEVEHYAGLVRIAGSAEDFVAHVRAQLLAPASPATVAERRRAVADATWRSRAESFALLAAGR